MEFIQKSIKNESKPEQANKEPKARDQKKATEQPETSKGEENQDLSTRRLGSQNKELKIETKPDVNYYPEKKKPASNAFVEDQATSPKIDVQSIPQVTQKMKTIESKQLLKK